jgi:tetratricopeptide (TPR) repeat protein
MLLTSGWLLLGLVLLAGSAPRLYRALLLNLGYVALNESVAQSEGPLDTIAARFSQADGYFRAAAVGMPAGEATRGRELARLEAGNLLRYGHLYDGLKDYQRALYWYDLASQAGQLSDPLYYQGLIINWRLPAEERDAEHALTLLLQAAERRQFSRATIEADNAYRIGLLYCNYLGASPDECLSYYRQALERDPGHTFAAMELGRQLYKKEGELALAEAYLVTALETEDSFEKKWAYYHLGELYREAGLTLLAEEQYRSALVIDPTFAPALQGLEDLP